MVEDLDPGLEATLRSVLRREAEAIPFAIRTADVERIRAERGRARRTQRWTVLSAAVVVLAIGGVALASALRPDRPASSAGDRFAGLPSFERLAEVGTGGGPSILRLEDVAGPEGRQWQFGLPAGAYAFEYLVACAGSNEVVVSLAAESVPPVRLGTVPCDRGAWRLAWDGTDDGAILAASSVSVMIDAQQGAAWRMLVMDDGSGRIVQRFGTSSQLFRLPSMDHIFQQRTAGAPELSRGSGLNEAASGTDVSALRGLGSAAAVEIQLACSGNQIDLSLGSSDPARPAATSWVVPCDGTLQSAMWVRDDATRDVSEAHLDVPAGTAWEAIAFDISANPPPVPASSSP